MKSKPPLHPHAQASNFDEDTHERVFDVHTAMISRQTLTHGICSLRLAHEDEMVEILDLIESRKHLFVDALQSANSLMSTHFVAQKTPATPLPSAMTSVPDLIDFDDLLAADHPIDGM